MNFNLFRHRGLAVSDSTGVMHPTMFAPVPQVKAQRKLFWLTVKDNTMPPRDWEAYDWPTRDRMRLRVNVAPRKIEAARKIPDMPVPAFLKRQAE